MTLTQGMIFAVTMLILFGGLFYTIWVFHKDQPGPSALRARARGARRGAGRS